MSDLPRDPVTGRCICDVCTYARRMNQSMPPADTPRLPTAAAVLDAIVDVRRPAAVFPEGDPARWPLPPLTAHRATLEQAEQDTLARLALDREAFAVSPEDAARTVRGDQ